MNFKLVRNSLKKILEITFYILQFSIFILVALLNELFAMPMMDNLEHETGFKLEHFKLCPDPQHLVCSLLLSYRFISMKK